MLRLAKLTSINTEYGDVQAGRSFGQSLIVSAEAVQPVEAALDHPAVLAT